MPGFEISYINQNDPFPLSGTPQKTIQVDEEPAAEDDIVSCDTMKDDAILSKPCSIDTQKEQWSYLWNIHPRTTN